MADLPSLLLGRQLSTHHSAHAQIHNKPTSRSPSIRTRRSPPITTKCFKGRFIGKTCCSLQDRQEPSCHFWLQDTVWWWTKHRFRIDLWWWGFTEEVWAKVQISSRMYSSCHHISTKCLSYLLVQSGLATKVDKASRKLRKERKNRAKKVGLTAVYPSSTNPYICHSSEEPKNPRLQSHQRRASRGEVTSWRLTVICLGACVSFRSCIYGICPYTHTLHELHAHTQHQTQTCQRGHLRSVLIAEYKWRKVYVLCMNNQMRQEHEDHNENTRVADQNPDFLWMISGSSWYSSADTHI